MARYYPRQLRLVLSMAPAGLLLGLGLWSVKTLQERNKAAEVERPIQMCVDSVTLALPQELRQRVAAVYVEAAARSECSKEVRALLIKGEWGYSFSTTTATQRTASALQGR